MQIPRLPVSGENLKKYLLESIRGIINYLHASEVRAGYGISVDKTASGTVISLEKRPATTSGGESGAAEYEAGTGITITGGTNGVPDKINVNLSAGTNITITGGTNGNPLKISASGGGGATGIYSSASSGSATIYLSGGSGSVRFKGAIYEDDGDIVVMGGTGMSAPVWSNSGHYAVLEPGNVPYPVPGDGWLYAFASVKISGTGLSGKYGAHVVVNGGEFKVCEIEADSHTFYSSTGNIGVGSGIVIPVKSGSTVSWRINETSGSSGVAAVTVGMVYYRIS